MYQSQPQFSTPPSMESRVARVPLALFISPSVISSNLEGSGLVAERRKGTVEHSPLILPFQAIARKVLVSENSRTLVAVALDMPLDISSPATWQDISSIFFADPFKPCREGNIKPVELRRVSGQPSGFFGRCVPAPHGFPIFAPISQTPRPRRVVGSNGLPVRMGPNPQAGIWAKPFGVPCVPHLPHDPSCHCRGYILTQAKRLTRTPFLLGLADGMEPHRKSPALFNNQDPQRIESAKRGGRCLARSGGVVAKSSGVYSMGSKGNHLVKFRVEPCKALLLHLRNFGGVGKNPFNACPVRPA